MMVRMSLIYVLGRYGASAVTLIAISLYTRLASPSDYGFFALVMAFATALYASFGQWLRQVLLRFAVRCEIGSDPLPSAILRIFLGLTFGLGLLLVTLGPWLGGEVGRAVLFSLPLLGAMGLFELSIAWLQLQLRSGFYVALSLLRTVSAALLGLYALQRGYGANGLIVATGMAYLIGALPVFVKTRFGLGRIASSCAELKPMIAFGLPLALSAALGSALALADRAIIAAMISTEAAGLYAAPYDLANRTLQVLMLAINLAGTPLILRAFEDGVPHTPRLIERQWLLLIVAGAPVTAAMMAMPMGLARILLGTQFQGAGAELMPLVALGTFLQGLESFYFGLAFTLSRKPLRQTLVLLVATVVNIGLTILLVPRIGIVGGAWATLISAIVALIGSAIVGRSLHLLPLAPRALVHVSFACGAMIGLMLWRSPGNAWATIITGAAGTAVYALALIALDVAGLRGMLVRYLHNRSSASPSIREVP